jgi:hypothetical protein
VSGCKSPECQHVNSSHGLVTSSGSETALSAARIIRKSQLITDFDGRFSVARKSRRMRKRRSGVNGWLAVVIERLIRRWKPAKEPSESSAVPFRLLIVFDQFEELIILHGLQDGEPAVETNVSGSREGEAPAEPPAAGDQPATPLFERVAAVRDVLKTLNDDPIDGVKVVLALRSDYRTMLTELDLPSINEPHIQREVGAFTRAQAKAILGESERTGFEAGQKKLQSVLSEAAIVDDNRGMIRPIVINMLGRVLQKHADAPDLPAHEEGRLLSQEVRAAVEDADVKEHAARILDPMLTDAGTKQPRTVGSLSRSTGLDANIIEGALSDWPRPTRKRAWVWSVASPTRRTRPIACGKFRMTSSPACWAQSSARRRSAAGSDFARCSHRPWSSCGWLSAWESSTITVSRLSASAAIPPSWRLH